jgi:hypothetical protein
MAEGAPRYHFGPLERRGLILGLRAGQGLTLLAAGCIFIICLRTLPGIAGGVVGFAILVVGAAIAFLPMGGRTAEQWAPVALGWAARRLSREDRHFSTAPLAGHEGSSGEPPAPALPAFLRGLSIIPAPLNAGSTAQIGVLKDDREKTFTAVLTVRGQSFALLDQSEKARILEGWGSVLAALAREGSLVSRVQWIERTFPEGGDAMGSYLREAVSLPVASTAVRSYLELVENAGPATQHHETLVVLQLDAKRAYRAIKQAGGRDAGACAVLAREIAFLANQLLRVGILVDGVLTPRLLAKAIRVAFDPQSRPGLARRAVDDSALAGVHPSNAWPIATVASWGELRTDSCTAATYWIREWPRVDVGPDFLAPFLLQTRAQRSVSLVMEPVAPQKAAREVQAARVEDISTEEQRRRMGFLLTARRRREQEGVLRREQELADGHGDYRFSGYVTVSAETEDELYLACGEVEQQAHQSHLELERMQGLQDIGFTYTLPLGRGLR